MNKQVVALVVLDGWGLNDNKKQNAILSAQTPNMDRLFAEYPHTAIGACGEDVGLTPGQMGNSEVGHLNIGAGRIVYQDLTKITKAIKDGDFFTNEVLLAAVQNCLEKNSALHLMGLLSDGGVHSHLDHLAGLLKIAKDSGLSKVYVHAFLDGRDVPPRSAATFFKEFEAVATKIGIGQIATIVGRYYAMDRDNRWERVSKVYEMLTELNGREFADPAVALADAYERGEDDEFVTPLIMTGAKPVQDNDSLIFFNFRPDRARELTRCFVDQEFKGFVKKAAPQVHFVCMTPYAKNFAAPIAFPKDNVTMPLAEVLSLAGLKQLHTAETEKYAHVTFFFNGGREEPFAGEDRILVNSPKVATYDLQPEMSAYEVTEKVLEAIEADKYDVIIMNYANTDMVGHTGVFAAATKAAEAVDVCVGKVVEKIKAKNGQLLITADHGNSDQMLDDEGNIMTAHSLNKVPAILVSPAYKSVQLRSDGVLADIAPTLLELLKIEQPAEWSGRSLIIKE